MAEAIRNTSVQADAGENSPALKKRIFIVDDHTMFREGLRQLIERESNLTVCGDAPDAAEALDLVDELGR